MFNNAECIACTVLHQYLIQGNFLGQMKWNAAQYQTVPLLPNKVDCFKAVFDKFLSGVFVGDLKVIPLFTKKSFVKSFFPCFTSYPFILIFSGEGKQFILFIQLSLYLKIA